MIYLAYLSLTINLILVLTWQVVIQAYPVVEVGLRFDIKGTFNTLAA